MSVKEAIVESRTDDSPQPQAKTVLPTEYNNVLEYLAATAPEKRLVSKKAFESFYKTAESADLFKEKLFQ